MNLRKKVSVVFGSVAAATVVAGAAAFACTNLATLNLSSVAGKAGDSVTVTGSSFNTSAAFAGAPVVLHWNGVDGATLASVAPDKAGNISGTFAVPQGQPGYYVVVATQANPTTGVAAYGTPARASFQILGPNGQSVVQPVATPVGSVGSDTSSSGIIALTVGLGVLGLALFGAGFIAFVRQARRVPAAATVRRD